jgi:hypothetical protein
MAYLVWRPLCDWWSALFPVASVRLAYIGSVLAGKIAGRQDHESDKPRESGSDS